MADDVDQANSNQEQVLELRIAAIRHQAEGHGRLTCVDCHDPIPDQRRKANPSAKRCIDCQEEFEEANG